MQITDTILMVRPAAFAFNAETAANNFFQNNINLAPQELQPKALKEFDAMVAVLKKNNINVIVVEDTPEPVKQDAIFPNNWFCTDKDGCINIFPMYAVSRRAEKREDVIEMLSKEFITSKISNWSKYEEEEKFLEGTGSMIIERQHKIIYACISERTNKFLLQKFADDHDYKIISFTAEDSNGNIIYHTNVMMCIGEKFAVICADAITNEEEKNLVIDSLENTSHQVIVITQDQVNAFAGNMLQVKNKNEERFIVLSATAFASLTNQQKEQLKKHGILLPMDVSIIEQVEGGSTRCMMAEIFLERN